MGFGFGLGIFGVVIFGGPGVEPATVTPSRIFYFPRENRVLKLVAKCR